MKQGTPDEVKAYYRDYFNRKYQERLAYALAKLGGACARCSSTDRLQFDHVDPATKLDSVTNLLMRRLSVLDAELAKCQLLCFDHHVEKSRPELAAYAAARALQS